MSTNDQRAATDAHAVQRIELGAAQRIVVKVGSAMLTDPENGLATAKIAEYCAQLHGLKEAGREVVLVSSGAVAEGCKRLGWSQRPDTVHQLQAAAAVGQMGLAQAYEAALSSHGRATAMVMLTHDDLADRERYLNARATLAQLLELGVVPVINENDTVATDEIRFGDNDTLAALVANLLAADLLIILTDVDGLMDADPREEPRAQRIASARAADTALDASVGTGMGMLGRGGMVTKLRAARLAARSGAHTIIASGNAEQIITRACAGDDVGSLLVADMTPMTARKRWIAGQLRARGDLVIDNGAAAAIRERGVSLLAVGVRRVTGRFNRGEVVRLVDVDGAVIAQGLSNYSSEDIGKLVGVKSEDFAQHITYVGEPELVHRDNLVLV